MATSFWKFKAPSTHAEELAMRQAAAYAQAEAIERDRQRRKEQEERDHEAWKRQLLRDRNVTIHASTQPSYAKRDDDSGFAAGVVTYAVLSNVSASSYSACDASPSDSSSSSSSSSSSDSSSGGGND